MSSAHNAKHRPNNTRRHSPNRRVSVPLSASAAASKNSEKRSVSRRSSEQLAINTGEEVKKLEGLLKLFYQMRNDNELPRSTLSVAEREKRILDKIKKAEALHEDKVRAHEEKRAQTVIRQRLANEKARQKENNKAKGIVRSKAVLSVNESVAAIQARTAAAFEKLKQTEAKMIENVKQKAQSSIAKSAETLAKLEEKCASIGWRKA